MSNQMHTNQKEQSPKKRDCFFDLSLAPDF